MWAIYFVNKEFNVYRDGGEGEKYKKINFSTELFMYFGHLAFNFVTVFLYSVFYVPEVYGLHLQNRTATAPGNPEECSSPIC